MYLRQRLVFKEILRRPIRRVPSLQGITVANLFFENSTRTRLSFELAEKRLSAEVVNFSSSNSSLSKGESLLDTVQNILHMRVDVVVMRHPQPGAVHFLSNKVHARLINAGDGTHEHPTQALLDTFSLSQKWGTLRKKTRPHLRRRAALTRGTVQHLLSSKNGCGSQNMCATHPHSETHHEFRRRVEKSLDKALGWCDAVNVLRLQRERQQTAYVPSEREYALYYGLKRTMIDRLSKEVLILHPGPINRGTEMESEVADAPQSIILNQVGKRPSHPHGGVVSFSCKT